MEKEFNGHIFLIGFMGAGKSSIARKLCERLNIRQVEMDELIEEQQGIAISDIFEKYGEGYFRDLETKLLNELKGASQAVISCGGGVPIRAENVTCMKSNGRLILLTAKPETILERVKDSNVRPILNNNMNVDYIGKLMEKRRELYLDAADFIIATDDKSVEQICDEIIDKL